VLLLSNDLIWQALIRIEEPKVEIRARKKDYNIVNNVYKNAVIGGSLCLDINESVILSVNVAVVLAACLLTNVYYSSFDRGPKASTTQRHQLQAGSHHCHFRG